ncbi:unnamed protein product [Camellia sinensis]
MSLVEPPLLDCHVPNLSPVESLQRQLYSILQESKFSDLISDQDELIFQDNQKTPFETDLGAILLKPRTAVENDTKTTSVAVKDGDSVLYDAPIKSAYSGNIHFDDRVEIESTCSPRMKTRSKASRKKGSKSLKQIYSHSSRLVGVQIPSAAEKTQGQQNVQQSKGADLVSNKAFEQKIEFTPFKNSSSNAFPPEITASSKLSTVLSMNISNVDSLTNDLQKNLNLNVSDDELADNISHLLNPQH